MTKHTKSMLACCDQFLYDHQNPHVNTSHSTTPYTSGLFSQTNRHACVCVVLMHECFFLCIMAMIYKADPKDT